jgi:hypothetical protein
MVKDYGVTMAKPQGQSRVRRIFHDVAVGGHSLREIIRRLAADAVLWHDVRLDLELLR